MMRLSSWRKIRTRRQQVEAISVICELEQLYEYFAIWGYNKDKVIEFGNINTSIDNEAVQPFQVLILWYHTTIIIVTYSRNKSIFTTWAAAGPSFNKQFDKGSCNIPLLNSQDTERIQLSTVAELYLTTI